MKFPRYWAKGSVPVSAPHPRTGSPFTFSCWGWSDTSPAEAEARGRQRADAVARRLTEGQRPDHYLYGDEPVREEVIESWNDADGSLAAAVTLNSYGCRVLNTASVIFVDVDIPEPAPSLTGGFKRLFGRAPSPSPREQLEIAALARLETLLRTDPAAGVRIYRTRAGLRYLLTHRTASPTDPATLGMMNELGADPLYVKLCRMQDCFRARLTPKPWRCGVAPLTHRYPWRDTSTEQSVRAWINHYEGEASAYATCALVKHLGRPDMAPAIARVVEYHDRMTRAESGLPLA